MGGHGRRREDECTDSRCPSGDSSRYAGRVPELPDVTVYAESLAHRVVGHTIRALLVRSPFLVRTVDPPLDAVEGRQCLGVERLGKRIVLVMEQDLFLVIHLMIAGRLRWSDTEPGSANSRPAIHRTAGTRIEQARLVFDRSVLTLTEVGTKKRASLHLVRTRESLRSLHAGGVDVLTCTPVEFAASLTQENRTLKRALTDPRIFDGIGNAYSDEILHAARLSPFKQTRSLDHAAIDGLRSAGLEVLRGWTDRLRQDFGLLDAAGTRHPGRFPGPGEITAFRPDFAVHGKFGKPCPSCSAPIQRIVYAERECNYCPSCQTERRILADRSLSRLLRSDWPMTLDDLEGS